MSWWGLPVLLTTRKGIIESEFVGTVSLVSNLRLASKSIDS